MALKPCRECKKDVSTEAKTCPHCGVAAPVKQGSGKAWLVALGTAGLVALCTSAKGKKSEEAHAEALPAQAGEPAAVAEPQEPQPAEVEAKPRLVLTESELRALTWLLREDLDGFARGGDALAERYAEEMGHGHTAVTADELQRAYEANEVAADRAYRAKKLLVRGKVESINRGIGDDHYLSLIGGTNMFVHPNARMDDGHADYLAELKKSQQVVLACVGGGMLIGSAWLNDCVPLEAWLPGVTDRVVQRAVAGANAGDKLWTRMVTMSLALDAVAPPEHPCWLKDKCGVEFSKMKKLPAEVRAKIATRLGIDEADVKLGK